MKRNQARVFLFSGLMIVMSAFGAMALLPQRASAAINSQINFQGKLTNPDGTNVTNGSYSLRFRIYTDATLDAASVCNPGTNTCKWEETQGTVTVTDGIFRVSLGSVTSLPGSVDFNVSGLYLGVKVGADAEMTPRVQFTASPYAFNAERLGGIASTGFVQLSPGAQQTGSINVSGTITSGAVNGITIGSTLQPSAAGVLNLRSNGANAISVDAGGGAAVNIGTTNASAVGIGRTGITTTNNGALTVTQGLTANSTVVVQNSTYTTNQLTITNGLASSTPTIPNAYIPTQVVRVSQTSGSRPLFFGYDNGLGTGWAGYFNIGACGSFSQMCVNLGDATNDYTALYNAGTTLNVGGGPDGNFTDVTFNNTGTVSIPTLSVTTAATLSGTLTLNNATSNLIQFGINGVAAPSFTSRSAGTKVVYYNALGGSSADYATGVESGILWNSVPTTSQAFRWYGGTTQVAQLSGSGLLTLSDDLSVNGGDITSTVALNIQSASATALSIDSGTTGGINIGTSANAKAINIGNTTAATTVATVVGANAAAFTVQGASGNTFLTVDTSATDQVSVGNATNGMSLRTYLSAGNQVSVSANAAPTVDQVSITNTGQPTTTAGVSGLQITYVGGAAAIESSAARVDLTPGTTSGGTWNGLRIVANATGAVSGVNEYALNLDGPTSPGAGNEVAINIDANWDAGLQIAARSTDPGTPATGSVYVYARSVAGRSLLRQKGPSGVSFAYQPALFEQAIAYVAPTNTEAVSVLGGAWTISAPGTGVAPTSTEVFGFTADFPTAATANSVSSLAQNVNQWTRGSVSGANGFFYVSRLAFPSASYGAGATGSRIWNGLTNQTAAVMTSGDNPAGDYAGFQRSTNRGDTNWQFMTKNGVTQNIINTNMPFAINKLYDFYVYTPPQGATVYWRVDNLTDGTTQEGNTAANLPTAATAMKGAVVLQTLSATSLNYRLAKIYIEADR